MRNMIKKHRGPRLCRVILKPYSRDIILLYRLFCETPPDDEMYIGDGSVFSLTVTKVDSGGTRREVKHLHDISRSRAEADRIFKTVSRACVMPSTAAEIVGDLIGI